MAARLKVYRRPAGFDDALVAAPSQKAALKAWGATSNLFDTGEAGVVDDPAIAAEALADPGKVIRRPRGDLGAMLAAAPRPKAPSRAPAPAAKPTSAKPAPPDRSRLDKAEQALARAEADFAERRTALEAEQQALEAEAERRLGVLRAARDKARSAFKAAST